MELGIYAVIGIAVIVAVAAFSKRLGVAAPIILVVVGVGLSYLPGVPPIEVPHEWVLDGLLPPILYAAAISVPVIDFRRNLNTIASLSVVLVIVTAFAVGFVLYMVLPDLNLAAAIALGAIVSPPDAVSATSVGRRLGLPPRLLTLLEGEGLVNDATALVILRSALVAALGGVLTPWEAVTDFLFAVVAAVLVGLTAAIATVYVRSKLREPVLNTAVSLVVPFVAFLPTEALGASGVLAVVVAGLYTGHAAPAHFSAQDRVSDRINWRTIQFLLESAVFLAIGLELRTLIAHVQDDTNADSLSVSAALGIGFLTVGALIVLRFLWMGPMLYLLMARGRREEKHVFKQWLQLQYYYSTPLQNRRDRWRRRALERNYERRRSDLEQLRREHIDWRGGLVLGWSGMRGVVTLAAAQSLPSEIPYRSQLILIAFTVAVVTLLVQGGTLPYLIKLLKVEGVDEHADRRELAQLLDDLSSAGLEVLDNPHEILDTSDDIDPDVLERVRQSAFLRSEAAWERARIAGGTQGATPHHAYRVLRRAVVDAERDRLLTLRALGTYPSRIFAEAQAMLDIEESRLRPPRQGH